MQCGLARRVAPAVYCKTILFGFHTALILPLSAPLRKWWQNARIRGGADLFSHMTRDVFASRQVRQVRQVFPPQLAPAEMKSCFKQVVSSHRKQRLPRYERDQRDPRAERQKDGRCCLGLISGLHSRRTSDATARAQCAFPDGRAVRAVMAACPGAHGKRGTGNGERGRGNRK